MSLYKIESGALRPFYFIFALMPVCVLINGEQKNIYWIGASIGALVLLDASHIVLYYFQYDIWQPYWTVLVDGERIGCHGKPHWILGKYRRPPAEPDNNTVTRRRQMHCCLLEWPQVLLSTH